MATSKTVQTATKPTAGKGSMTEAKTNEDFNKTTPKKDDPQLKVKKVKK